MSLIRKIFSPMITGICLITFAFCYICAMEYSYHCFTSLRIILYSLLGAVTLGGIYLLLRFLSRFQSLMKALFLVIFLGFVSLCLYLNFTCKNDYNSIIDYGFIVDAAEEYARIGNQFDYSYFSNFTVNIFVTFVLSWLIKLSWLLHIEDYYYVFAAIATIIEAITMLSVAYLAYSHQKKIHDAIMAMIALGCFLPMYALMPFLYTDMMTFCTIPVTFALMKIARQNKSKTKASLLNALAGLILAFGILVKFTVIIPMIALLIIFFLRKEKMGLWVLASVCCLGVLCGKLYIQSHDFVKECQKTENPSSAWILTGMSENGSFAKAYHTTIKGMYDYETKEEKDAYCKALIKENWPVFFNPMHYVKKTERVYGLCDFGITEYEVTGAPGHEYNRIYMYFSKYEKTYATVLDLSASYLGSILLIFIIGLVFELRDQRKKQEISPLCQIISLSFVGYFLFLMLMETSHHQIFNLMPLMFTGVAICLNRILQFPIKEKDAANE